MSARAAMTMTVSQPQTAVSGAPARTGWGRGGGHGERVRKNGTGFRTCSESLCWLQRNPVASASPPDLLQAMLGEQQRRQACGAMDRIPSRALIAASPGQQHQKDFEQVLNVDAPRCCATQGRTRARG